MMPISAKSRLVSTTLLIAPPKSLAIGVVWTIPMMIPTQALAATRETPPLAALVNAFVISGRQLRWINPKINRPYMPKKEELKILSNSVRNSIWPVSGEVQESPRKPRNCMGAASRR